MTDDQIFTKEEIAEARPDTALPPPGYDRNEELLRRQDALEAKLDALLAQRDVQTMNPEALKEDREIQHVLQEKNDGLNITDPEPGYEYCWARAAGDDNHQVWERKARGWEVVSGNTKTECGHLKREDNTRRIGDTILMRIRVDLHLRNVQEDHARLLKRQFGVDSELRSFAANHPGAFRSVASSDKDADSPIMQRVMSRGETSSAVRKAAARQLDPMLRKGTVPGVPVKGGRG